MPSIQQVYYRHAKHYKSVLGTANYLYSQGGEAIEKGFKLFDINRNNIQTGQKWIIDQASKDCEVAKLCKDLPKSGGYILYLRLTTNEMKLWLEAALSASRQLKDTKMEAIHLGNLGNAYRDLGDTQKAINIYLKQLEIVKEFCDRINEAITLNNLGSAYEVLGEISSAIDNYTRSFDIYVSLENQPSLAIVMSNLGSAYTKLGSVEYGIELNQKAISIAKSFGDLHTEALITRNLADIYRQQYELTAAIEYYKKALEIHNKLAYRRGIADTLGNMGMCYIALEQIEKGIELCRLSLNLFQQIGYFHCVEFLQSVIDNAISFRKFLDSTNYFFNNLLIPIVINNSIE